MLHSTVKWIPKKKVGLYHNKAILLESKKMEDGGTRRVAVDEKMTLTFGLVILSDARHSISQTTYGKKVPQN
jgi:hypothetical protein